MDKSRSPSATAALPPTHMPGPTTPRHSHCRHGPNHPPCPRTITTRHGPCLDLTEKDLTVITNEYPTAFGLTTTIPPAPILHEDSTAVGPTTMLPTSPILHNPTQPEQTMDCSTTADQTTLKQATMVDSLTMDCLPATDQAIIELVTDLQLLLDTDSTADIPTQSGLMGHSPWPTGIWTTEENCTLYSAVTLAS